MTKQDILDEITQFLEHVPEDEYIHVILLLHEGDNIRAMAWPPGHIDCCQELLESAAQEMNDGNIIVTDPSKH